MFGHMQSCIQYKVTQQAPKVTSPCIRTEKDEIQIYIQKGDHSTFAAFRDPIVMNNTHIIFTIESQINYQLYQVNGNNKDSKRTFKMPSTVGMCRANSG